MLKKENRLKNRVAFYATYKQNRSVSDGLFVLYGGKKLDEGEVPKIGFVVSKKVHKSAVKRNRIKRLLREAVRLYIKNGGEIKFLSLIFVAKKGALDKNYNEVNRSFLSLLGRLNEKVL